VERVFNPEQIEWVLGELHSLSGQQGPSMSQPVYLHLYDLSSGMAKALSFSLLGKQVIRPARVTAKKA